MLRTFAESIVTVLDKHILPFAHADANEALADDTLIPMLANEIATDITVAEVRVSLCTLPLVCLQL